MIWCTIRASPGLAKAFGRAKLALGQLPVLNEISLSPERGVLLPPRGTAVPSPDCIANAPTKDSH